MMKKPFLIICCIAAMATNAFSQNIASRQGNVQFTPQSFEDNFCLVRTNCLNLKEANQTAEAIHKAGGRIAVIGSPEFMIGWIPAELREALTAEKHISAFHTGSYRSENVSPSSDAIINYFNAVVSGELFQNGQEAGQNYLTENPTGKNCIRIEDKNSRSVCEQNKNSEYLRGSVSCGVFFVESNGAADPNSYTWTSTNRNNIKTQILDAFSIWAYTASQNGISLTFTPVWYEAPSTVINQPYEPILHSSDDDGLWITSILSNLGYNSGDKFTDTHNYNWDLRNTNGTNWAYAAFIINNPSPAPTFFSNGATSYAYKGGPYTNLLLRASAWPISTFFRGFAHESAHIFNAFDEYDTADPDNCGYAFNGVVNTNYQDFPCNGSLPCVMVDNVYFGTGSTRQWHMCNPTKSHIGWLNLTPAPSIISPINNLGVPQGNVNLAWNRNTSNPNIHSLIRVTDTSGTIIDCSVLATASSAQVFLQAGVYKWQVVNGTDLWDGGYAEVSSPVYTLYVGISGAEESQAGSGIEIVPDPATDQITILNLQLGSNTIEVYDMPGQRIFSGQVSGHTDYSISTANLSKGCYLLAITNSGKKKITKLLIR